ncbi:DUF2314 domain-containing protein [Hymenobacter crusticola]|uniref:DUF2314 domain-containing protein n=1 Tax=Hymenobacter crusticola TaxID=1770526 RepID=UPI000A3CEB71|nr:DUF2314 domain-containing protein [Hymenobacter crusticola]
MIKKDFSCLYCSLILFACISCDPSSTKPAEREKGVYSIESNDPEMTLAIKRGKASFSQFLSAMQQQDSANSNFAVKVHYDDGEQVEHIWLSNLTVENSQLYGVVDNVPEFTKQVKEGQKVKVDTSLVTDWNYTRGKKLIGGYTIKLLRERMTPAERTEFDESTGWEIE